MISPKKSRPFRPCKVEPWSITPTGEIVRVVIHREYLNPRQERFALEYLKDGNGTQAAIRAGYASSSAAVHACRLLENELVVEKIKAQQNHLEQSDEVLRDKTLRELEAVAFADTGRIFDRKWNLLPPDKWPKDAYRMLESLNVQDSAKGRRKVRSVRVRFVDKGPALTALAKWLGLIPVPLKRGR